MRTENTDQMRLGHWPLRQIDAADKCRWSTIWIGWLLLRLNYTQYTLVRARLPIADSMPG